VVEFAGEEIGMIDTRLGSKWGDGPLQIPKR
jgi:hypothetical protein